MADISFMGATYTDVESVTLPKVGGGVATFSEGGGGATIEPLSVTENGTYTAPSGVGYSPVTVSVAGGASNIVTGTFIGKTANAAMDISLNYTGSGYPVSVEIYPTGGYGFDTAISAQSKRYGVVFFSAVKKTANAPKYTSSNEDDMAVYCRAYKSSSSSGSESFLSCSNSPSAYIYSNAEAASSINVRFLSAKRMSVFIAGTSYGFIVNREYTYQILYSE